MDKGYFAKPKFISVVNRVSTLSTFRRLETTHQIGHFFSNKFGTLWICFVILSYLRTQSGLVVSKSRNVNDVNTLLSTERHFDCGNDIVSQSMCWTRISRNFLLFWNLWLFMYNFMIFLPAEKNFTGVHYLHLRSTDLIKPSE